MTTAAFTLAPGPVLVQTDKAMAFAVDSEHLVWVPKSLLFQVPSEGGPMVWAWSSDFKPTKRPIQKQGGERILFVAKQIGESEKGIKLLLEDQRQVWAPKAAVSREGDYWSISFQLAVEKNIRPHISA